MTEIVTCPFCRASASTAEFYAKHLIVYHGYEVREAADTALGAFTGVRHGR